MKYKIEIAVFSPDDAIKAADAGAHRIELCASMNDGGITPTHGTIKFIRQHIDILAFAMIRPRGGNFVYSSSEIEVMIHDIEYCKNMGINGIVFGVLLPNGDIDIETCKKLKSHAGNMECTFHRAFDVCNNPLFALEQIIEMGFNRILTSGQKQIAPQGISLIRDLVEKSKNRIIIMPGSGVDEKNLASLFKETSALEYHSSAKIASLSKASKVNMSSIAKEVTGWEVSSEIVKEMVHLAGEFEKQN